MPVSPGDGFVGSFRAGAAAAATDEQPSIRLSGRIRNLAALRADLGAPPDLPVQALLQRAWRRWSDGLFARLDGEFALALADGDRLLLCRDPSGLCHLYWHQAADGRVRYATDLAVLLRQPGVPRRIARHSLHEYLRFLDISAPNTVYEGIQSVEPGGLQGWTGTQRTARPLRPDAAADPAMPERFDDCVDALQAHLQCSVEQRLAGASRPAAFLSGGIDSALLCALAARQRGDLTAITVGFDGDAFDESRVAAGIASHLGLAHEVLRFDHDQYLQAFDTLARRMDQPMADPATPATLLAFEFCQRRFDSVLDGGGADEAVGALPPRHIRLATGPVSRLPAPLRQGLAQLLRASPRWAGYAPIVDYEHPADTMIRWRGFTRPEVEALCGEPVSFAHTQFYRTYERHSRRDPLERYRALMTAMPSERLNQALRVVAAPVQFPFWDGATDRYLRQLPRGYRFRPGEPKRILRALLARHLPAALWDLPKHSFDFPLQAFLSAQDHALVHRHLAPARWQAHGLLDADRVWDYARRFIAGDRQLMFRIWSLVVLGAWLEAQPGQP